MSTIFILIEFDIILIKLLCSYFVCFFKWYNSLLSLLFGSSSYCILYSYTICDTVSFFNEMFAQSEEGDEQDIQYLVKQQDHSWCEGVQVITSITASCCWWESVFRNIEARRRRGEERRDEDRIEQRKDEDRRGEERWDERGEVQRG